MPHYITVRIENGNDQEEMTEQELNDLGHNIQTHLQDVNDIIGLSESHKVGNNVSIYKSVSYAGVPDSEL